MRILIADDHGIVRSGLKLLIDRQPDMEVVAEAEDGVEAFETTLRVRDDGSGFKSLPNGRSRLGVSGMRERALLVGGRLSIYSNPGEGTTIELTMGAI